MMNMSSHCYIYLNPSYRDNYYLSLNLSFPKFQMVLMHCFSIYIICLKSVIVVSLYHVRVSAAQICITFY